VKESKEQRKIRQDREEQLFISVLRDAGNRVDTEVMFDTRPEDKSQSPPIPRRWRIDVALPDCDLFARGRGRDGCYPTEDIAIEIQGIGWGHAKFSSRMNDIEKNGELFAQGWTALQVSRAMIADGTALDLLARRGVRVTRK